MSHMYMCTDYYEMETLLQTFGIAIQPNGKKKKNINHIRKSLTKQENDTYASNNEINEKQRDRDRLHITYII